MENDKSKEVKKSSSTPQKPNSEPPKKDDNRKVILNLVTVVFLFMVVSLVLIVAQRLDTSKREDPKQFSDLISLIRDDKVSKIEVSPDQKTLFVEVYKDQNNKKRSEVDRKEFPNISIEKSATVVQNINTALGGKEENRIKIETF